MSCTEMNVVLPWGTGLVLVLPACARGADMFFQHGSNLVDCADSNLVCCG